MESSKREKVISIEEYSKDLEDKIKNIIKDATYTELRSYIEALPMEFSCEESLWHW